MVRITLTGDALTGFTSAAAFMRDYTPRRFDAARHELDIDFVLHDSGHSSGPAADWAAAARPGSMLGVGDPSGSFVVSGPLDWHLLVGDETALPAIGRHLEELPVTAQVDVLIEVGQPTDEIALQGPSHMRLKWLRRFAPGRDPKGSATPGLLASPSVLVRCVPFSWRIITGPCVGQGGRLLEARCGGRARSHRGLVNAIARQAQRRTGYLFAAASSPKTLVAIASTCCGVILANTPAQADELVL